MRHILPTRLPLFCLALFIALVTASGTKAEAVQSAEVIQVTEISGKQTRVFGPAAIEVGGSLVHLEGLRAPTNDQICSEGPVPWTCGRDARWATLNRVGNHWITCLDRGRTSDGAFLGLCYLGGVGGPELNGWLVAQGWALTDALGAERYVSEETSARAGRLGLWRNGVEPSWD